MHLSVCLPICLSAGLSCVLVNACLCASARTCVCMCTYGESSQIHQKLPHMGPHRPSLSPNPGLLFLEGTCNTNTNTKTNTHTTRVGPHRLRLSPTLPLSFLEGTRSQISEKDVQKQDVFIRCWRHPSWNFRQGSAACNTHPMKMTLLFNGHLRHGLIVHSVPLWFNILNKNSTYWDRSYAWYAFVWLLQPCCMHRWILYKVAKVHRMP